MWYVDAALEFGEQAVDPLQVRMVPHRVLDRRPQRRDCVADWLWCTFTPTCTLVDSGILYIACANNRP